MPTDPFAGSGDSLISPAKNAFAIAPHATADLPVATKAIYIGTGGNLAVRTVDGDADIVFANVPAGCILPVRVRAVRATSTAADLVGLA